MALRFAVVGAGFWTNYQIAAWKELEGMEIVAICNRTASKAQTLAEKFHIPNVYTDVDTMLNKEALDVIDIITNVGTHAQICTLAASRGVGVICQKPMAAELSIAQQMVDLCQQQEVPFYVHENFRWQAPIRELKKQLESNTIGTIFKARVTFCSGFPVFENQPFLAEVEEFILADIGSHVLDICRFLFGEVDTLLCHTKSVTPGIKGEDVANVAMQMKNGAFCFAEMSYASILEREPFPQTFVMVEGDKGSIHLTYDHKLKITTRAGTHVVEAPPKMYDWLDPEYALVHSSIVDCNRDILNDLKGTSKAETTGIDNLETVRLVQAAYASARNGQLIQIDDFE